MTTANTDAEDSICPRGWKIPSNTGEKSWENLFVMGYGFNNTHDYDNYGWNKSIHWPINFGPTGWYYSGDMAAYARASYGHWWSISSSVFQPTKSSYGLYMNNNDADSGWLYYQYTYSRGSGYAIRCVVRS